MVIACVVLRQFKSEAAQAAYDAITSLLVP